MASKLIWVCLAIIMIAIIMHPPDFGHSPETTEKPPAAVVQIHPNAVARSWMSVPGAIVCSNATDVNALIDLYNEHWKETQEDTLSHGKSVLLRGPATPAPDPKVFGCSLLPPGTLVQAENAGLGDVMPGVTAKLPEGTIVRGLTWSLMLSAR
jgi:hypothetical protein